MDEDKLIDDLTNDLKPVKPVSCCMMRLCLWLPVALAVLAGSLFYHGLRPDGDQIMTLPFILESLLLFGAGLFAAFAAIRLSIPDTKLRLPVILSLTIPTAIWLGLNIYSYMMASAGHIATAMGHHARFGQEIVYLVIMVTLPAAFLFYLIGRAAPTFSGWAAYAVILATASFAALAMRMICGFEGNAHLFVYHFLPVLALALLGPALGRVLLRW